MLLPLAMGLFPSFFGNPPTLDSLPPRGTTIRIVEREYRDGLADVFAVETSWVANGKGTGLRTSHRHTSFGSIEETVVEGFANGLPYPDRLLKKKINAEGDSTGYVFLRKSLPTSQIWVKDTIPGYRFYPFDDVDSITIVLDPLGREIERRTKCFSKTLAVRRKEWGPWGPVVETDSFFDGQSSLPTEVRIDSTSWEYGQRTGTRHYELSSTFSTAFLECSKWKDGKLVSKDVYDISRNVDDKPFVSYRTTIVDDSIEYLHTTWYDDTIVESSVDTIHVVREADGTQTRWRLNMSGLTFVQQMGPTGAIIKSVCRNARGTAISGDSSIWEGGRLVQNVPYFQCDSEGNKCVYLRHEYEYATLDVATSISHAPERPKFALHQHERALGLTGNIPDGAVVRLRSIDGRQIASSRFLGGTAHIDLVPCPGLVLWLVEADGKLLGEGGFLVR